MPASEFVLTFLGPATSLNGRWVRPHDLLLHRTDEGTHNPVEARVDRVALLGFEVRVELTTGSGPVWAQLSRADAARLDLGPGDTVWVTLRDGDRRAGPGEVPMPAAAVSAANAGPSGSAR